LWYTTPAAKEPPMPVPVDPVTIVLAATMNSLFAELRNINVSLSEKALVVLFAPEFVYETKTLR